MTKPSPHQLYMLAMFEKGWRFDIWNRKPGSWCTYWALRRKGLCSGVSDRNELTDKGREALMRWWKKNVTG